MTDTADPALPTPFTPAWSSTSAQDDLRSWAAYLGEHGVTWSPQQAERDLVDSVTRSMGDRAGKFIGMRLEKLANDTLSKAADARRVHREVTTGAQRWHLVTPAQRTALEQTGVRFESGNDALRNLATIPLTLGVYFGADYVCRSMGLSPTIAWVIALVVYMLTVRMVRGRWPLQPAR